MYIDTPAPTRDASCLKTGELTLTWERGKPKLTCQKKDSQEPAGNWKIPTTNLLLYSANVSV
jgi:hypothetical protein